ncbi:MAG: hypothetical protein R3236_11745, partial [Phycisphaeraceae bacterium]|nr:hypothetical protein [Phycisphaeraceae bacterium]
EDEYSFWGGSLVIGPDGHVLSRARLTEPDLLLCDLDRKMLREQRIKLPFRRDDSLAHTVELGKRILQRKGDRDNLPHDQVTGMKPVPKPK